MEKKLSGSAFKKLRLEKEQRQNEVIKNTQKLDHFFLLKTPLQSSLPASVDTTSLPDPNVVEGEKENKNNSNLKALNLTTQELPTIITNNSNTAVDIVTSSRSLSDLNSTALLSAPLHEDSISSHEPQSMINSFEVENDPALWLVNENLINYFSRNGFVQNIEDEKFPKSKRRADDRYRFLHKDLFKTNLINGEKISRNYLIYSKSLGSVFCGPCRLFDSGKSPLASNQGFSDWKHAYERLNVHETSLGHKNCILKMKIRGQAGARIDSKLFQQLEDEKKYWRNVLLRVIVAVKSLATRGLSFRGKTDKFGSTNNGNFMMILEAISEFDPFLAKHIHSFGNPGKGNTSYLSFATYEKIIKIMADKVKTTIIEQLKKAKYFSLIVDSTPDVTNVDQLSLIVRYVQDDAEPVERFLCFLPNTGHKAEDMFLAIMNTFETLNIDINNCRGQSYDNASNMSGQYNGLQAKIKEKCQYATYVPCATHSLNLIGSSAAECCPEAIKFFGFLQNLYVFFSSSTERTKLLQTFLNKPENVTVKNLSFTRWSARDDACTSLNKDWKQIIAALEALKNDCAHQKALVKNEATGLLAKLNSLEIAILSEFWGSILKQFNIVSKILQGVDTNVEIVSSLYESLITSIENKRESFDVFEKAGKKKSSEEYSIDRKRIVKRKKNDDECPTVEVILQGRDHFRVNTFFPICDQLLGELKRRKSSYEAVTANFSFLCKLDTMSEAEVRIHSMKLQKLYPIDITGELQEECVLLKQFLTSNENKMSLRQLNQFIKQNNLKEAFPYTEIALRIFLCTAVTNCSAERSFSVLKRIKNYLRSRISEERLNSLAILNIEADVTKSINNDIVIDEFVNQFVHRKQM